MALTLKELYILLIGTLMKLLFIVRGAYEVYSCQIVFVPRVQFLIFHLISFACLTYILKEITTFPIFPSTDKLLSSAARKSFEAKALVIYIHLLSIVYALLAFEIPYPDQAARVQEMEENYRQVYLYRQGRLLENPVDKFSLEYIFLGVWPFGGKEAGAGYSMIVTLTINMIFNIINI